jgi:hypothetical protein
MKRFKPTDPSGNFSEIVPNCVSSRILRNPVRFPLNHISDEKTCFTPFLHSSLSWQFLQSLNVRSNNLLEDSQVTVFTTCTRTRSTESLRFGSKFQYGSGHSSNLLARTVVQTLLFSRNIQFYFPLLSLLLHKSHKSTSTYVVPDSSASNVYALGVSNHCSIPSVVLFNHLSIMALQAEFPFFYNSSHLFAFFLPLFTFENDSSHLGLLKLMSDLVFVLQMWDPSSRSPQEELCIFNIPRCICLVYYTFRM